MQAKFLFHAYSTKIVPFYLLRCELRPQRISSCLMLPVFKLGSQYLNIFLPPPFLSMTWTQLAGPSHSHTYFTNTVTSRKMRLHHIWGNVPHSSLFSHPHKSSSLSCTDARYLDLSHTATCSNKCIPASYDARLFWSV